MLPIAAAALVTLLVVATSAALTAPSANFGGRSGAHLRYSTSVSNSAGHHSGHHRASLTARRAHAFDFSWCRPGPIGSVPVGSSFALPGAPFEHHGHLPTKHRPAGRLRMSSNFYDDFGDGFGDDEEDEDNDEEDDGMSDEEKAKIEMFRTQMMMGEGKTGFGGTSEAIEEDVTETGADDGDGDGDGRSFGSVDDLISFASSKAGVGGGTGTEVETDWAVPLLEMGDDARPIESGGAVADALRGGAVLLANPAKFCADFSWGAEEKTQQPSAALLSKFGLTLPPPAELGPDRRADLLPVLMVLDRHPLRGSQAVLMNRRTGYLLGDLEQQDQLGEDDPAPSSSSSTSPRLGAFMIQPLWFGGTSAGSNGAGGGLDMLHQCQAVKGCKRLTEDGLFWGGDPVQAQDAMADPSLEKPLTGFEFKFFVQSTRWLPTQLEKEVREGTWFVASVSKEVLFKSRDRLGTKRAKPLWSEIMELLGGNYQSIRDELYTE